MLKLIYIVFVIKYKRARMYVTRVTLHTYKYQVLS